MKNRLYTVALCGCLALGVTTGCTSEEPAEVARATSDAPLVAPVVSRVATPGAKTAARVRPPSVDAAATIRANARWLPANIDMVFTADARSSTDLVNFWSVTGDSARTKKIRTHFDAMLGELGGLSDERLGMNPLGMTALIGGLDTKGEVGTLIVLGATVAAKDTEKLGSFDAFKILPRHPADAAELTELTELAAKNQPWALKLPDGSGVVISTRGILEKLAKDESASLAKSDVLTTYADALKGAPSHLAFAVGAPFFEQMAEREEDDDLKALEFFTLSMNEVTTTATLRASDDAKLAELEKEYRDTVAEGNAKMKKAYDVRDDKNTGEALLAIVGYHGVLAVDDSIKMERKPGVITVSVHNAALSSLSSLSSLFDLADELE